MTLGPCHPSDTSSGSFFSFKGAGSPSGKALYLCMQDMWATCSHQLPSFLRPWERESPRKSPLGDLHGRDKTVAGPEITRPTEKTSAKLNTDLSCLMGRPSKFNREAGKTPGHIMGISPGEMNDMLRAWVFKEPDPHSSQRRCCMSWVSALSQEPGGGQGWLKVTQWPAGSQAGPMPGPQAPPSLQTQICWSGEEGELVSSSGLQLGTEGPFFAAQRSPCLPRARLQPPSSPADEENLVPASTNMCAFWREEGVRFSDQVGGFKGPEGSHRMGAEQATGVFFKRHCRD